MSDTHLFTGIQIKKYLQKNYFQNQTSNPKVQSGFWSAYAHYDSTSALKNIFSKIFPQKVAIDPSLPINLRVLFPTATQLEIDKDTLVPTPELNTFYEDTIILYSQNGHVSLKKTIEYLQSLQKTVILILDTKYFTSQSVEMALQITKGAVVFILPENPVQNDLQGSVHLTLQPFPLVLSWILEDRITASLEYQLAEGTTAYQELLQLLYVYTKPGLSVTTLLPNLLKTQLQGLGKDIKPKDVPTLIPKVWQSIELFALPDVFFDLLNTQNIPNRPELTESSISTKAQLLHQYFLKQIPNYPSGSLMVPPLSTESMITKFLFFTTNPNLWIQQLTTSGYTATKLQLEQPVTENQLFLHKYGVLVNLV